MIKQQHSLQLIQSSGAVSTTTTTHWLHQAERASTHAHLLLCSMLSPLVSHSVSTVVPKELFAVLREHFTFQFTFSLIFSLDECVCLCAGKASVTWRQICRQSCYYNYCCNYYWSDQGNRARDIQLGLPRLWGSQRRRREWRKSTFSVYFVFLGHSSNISCCCCRPQSKSKAENWELCFEEKQQPPLN